MIIKFNPSIFNNGERKFQRAILMIIMDFFEGGFLWDLPNIEDVFGEDGETFYQSKFAQEMLSDGLLEELTDVFNQIFLRSAYITDTHKCYLSTITIGLDEGEISPEIAQKILLLPSLLILENGNNDWNFIKGLLSSYKNQKDRKPIYSLIKKAIDNHRLLSENAGGSGGILKRATSISTNQFLSICKLKVAILFDSDRSSSLELNEKWVPLLEWLKNRKFDKAVVEEFTFLDSDQLRWHMLYKREMENYLPLDLLSLQVDFTVDQAKGLEELSAEEHDFYNFDVLLNEPNLKNTLPLVFQQPDIKEQLEDRCSHHKCSITIPSGINEQVCEHEKILLMIAKII